MALRSSRRNGTYPEALRIPCIVSRRSRSTEPVSDATSVPGPRNARPSEPYHAGDAGRGGAPRPRAGGPMKLGDVANAAALRDGKPLDWGRVRAAEQLQALPLETPV